MSSTRHRATALLLACHPVPSAAVTLMMIALFGAAGSTARTIAVGTTAVLLGQLSIGWSNDAIDAGRDERAGRPDKPVARGELTRRAVRGWALAALGGTVVFSLLLGWRAGVVHLLGVGCGWAYNAGLKATVWSPAPFAVAFGGLPAVATLSLSGHPWPPVWSMLAGALIGVAAHFGNVAPDIADDRLAGVLGLPQRMGEQAAALTAIGSALASCLIVVLADPLDAGRAAGLLAAVVVAVVGLLRFRRRGGEAAFFATVAIAAIGVTLLATSPSFPTG